MGRIVGVFGLKGWVKLESYARPREDVFQYQTWRVCGRDVRVMELLEGRIQGRGLVAHLAGCEDLATAQGLIGARIEVPRSALPELPPGMAYWEDLEGLRVVDVTGIEYGVISHLIETGANDVLVVRDAGRERLIPYTKDVIRGLDWEAGLLRVDWAEADAD
ncbi:MAG TPA: ribosome maturation factor RimM [Acidiferrobacteraceae bacterium]|nr:ribosome maturation factor RimM [Acidiferrobacteraceae bacterium]